MKNGKRILIIGGVAGGASCATRARRLSEEAEIIIFEKGPVVSFASCGLPYYVGDVIKKEEALLVATADLFRKRFNIDVRLNAEVTSIDRKKKRNRNSRIGSRSSRRPYPACRREKVSRKIRRTCFIARRFSNKAFRPWSGASGYIYHEEYTGQQTDQGMDNEIRRQAGDGGRRRIHRSRDDGKPCQAWAGGDYC